MTQQPKRPSTRPAKNIAKASPPPIAPLKPRRALFIALCLIFAAWMVFLVVLYFRTLPGSR